MKKFLVALCVVGITIAPITPVQAAVLTDEAKLQLIATLLEQIKILQAKLDLLKAKQGVTTVSLTDKTEYRNKVEPLLDELDETEEEIEALEERIEQKECNRPFWYYSDGERTFNCRDDSETEPKESDEITDLKEQLEDLEKEKEDLEEEIEDLKTQYGI